MMGVALVANATPIKPTIQDMLKQPSRPQINFPPARVGWNGPEQTSAPQEVNLTLEKYGPQGTILATQASIASSFRPDWRYFAGFGVLILLLRILRRQEELGRQPKTVEQATGSPAYSNQSSAAQKELKAA